METGPFGILPKEEGPIRKRLREKGYLKLSPQGTALDEDIFLDIVWALQDIAIIRALEGLKDDPKAVALINEYFHMLLDHLLTEDLPRHGMDLKDVSEAKAIIEKARAYPIGSENRDSELAAADGTFCRFLDEYIQRYCRRM